LENLIFAFDFFELTKTRGIESDVVCGNGNSNLLTRINEDPGCGNKEAELDRDHTALPTLDQEDFPTLLVISAADNTGIDRLVALQSEHFDRHSKSIAMRRNYIHDLAYTLADRRSIMSWRSFMVLDSANDILNISKLVSQPTRAEKSPGLCFVFSGQGAQWPRMALDLVSYRSFAESLRRSEDHLFELGCSWSLLGMISDIFLKKID
jgi:acyl transferase domain-containing protein